MTRRPGAEITEDVSSFIRAYLRSVDDLQLLVVFVHSADEWWDTEAIGRKLRLGLAEAQEALTRFVAGNLLEVRFTERPRYRFRPGYVALHEAVGACLAAFETNPIAVIRAIYGVANEVGGDLTRMSPGLTADILQRTHVTFRLCRPADQSGVGRAAGGNELRPAVSSDVGPNE
jgi:hypothetical protein